MVIQEPGHQARQNPLVDFKNRLANLFKARFPFIYLTTWEEERALTTLHALAADVDLIKTPRKVFTWTITKGLACQGQVINDTTCPLKALEAISCTAEPAIFVLHDFHMYFGTNTRPPEYPVLRRLRELVTEIKHTNVPKNVVFLSPTLMLPTELEKDVYVVEMALPDAGELQQLLKEMILANEQSGRIQVLLKSQEVEHLVNAIQGLTLQEAENALAHAMVNDGKLNARDISLILEEKRQIIQKTGILEFIKSQFDMSQVGGLQNLKKWLQKRNKAWLDDARLYGLPAPKGILITGVPGCGKSLIAKSASTMWQLPLLRLDVGRIFSGLVGSSEENMRKAIKTAEAISPCILWIDEIEKGFNGTASSGDSGTSSRVFGTFLTWMQEKEKPVFIIATANNIHALPPEFMRKGRFDEIFFVDLPTRLERIDIFRVHMQKRLTNPEVRGDFQLTDQVLNHLAQMSEGFIGSEVEQAVITAHFEAYAERRCVRLSDYEEAIRNTVPLSTTQAEQIRGIREWANVRAVSATAQSDRSEYQATAGLLERPAAENPEDIFNARGGRTVDF